ncbi:MAG TPA: TlpA disulfide reductase family protein [Blastocatellia bacterium]|nr:TlpA disulfide reductase family protein [Blastocatellia bacterium]
MQKGISLAIVYSLLMIGADARTPQQSGPRTVAECLQAVQQYRASQAEAARRAGQEPNYPAYEAQARDLAKQYASRFKLDEVSGADLPTLALLYVEAGEHSLARAATDRRLNEANLGDVYRAEALATAVVVITKGAPRAEDLRLAEEFTAQLDALSDAALKQKIAAHKRLGGYYYNNDLEEEKVLRHDAATLKLVAQLPTEERDTFARQNLSVYHRLATGYGNRGLIEKALETCRQGSAEALRQGRPEPRTSYDRCIERYSLLGRPGAPIKGAYWLNAAPETEQLDLRGRVTLLHFTAHWCVTCRNSYPGLLKINQQFNERGLRIVLSTQLYGHFAGRQDLKPREELASIRQYYLGQHKLPFKIAVEPQFDLSDKSATADAAWRESNEGKYFGGGYPKSVLLDKQGIVRQILLGWDPATEARLISLIEQLLKEH